MKLYDLWPTRVVNVDVPLELCTKIYSQHVSIQSKDYEQVLDDNDKRLLLEYVNRYYLAEYDICDGWIRTLTSKGHNNFELHCDSHYGNQLVGVLQLFGDEDNGGDIKLYDPAWRNPQWMSDTKNKNSNSFIVPFKVGQFIIFPANVWHSVETYYGESNRVTLNLMFRRIS